MAKSPLPDYLLDLSEEWPQESPATIAHNAQSPAATKTPQSARSRLPRMRRTSGSFSEIPVRSIAKELRPPKQRSALLERSYSDINAPPAPSSPNASHIEPPRRASYSSFSMSQGSGIQYGTVAHNTAARSPTKEPGSHDTPEWRRRLVNGQVGYGGQTDLFGPTGLENIFQPPAGGASDDSAQPKRRLGLLKGLSAVPLPSSPPPWPATRRNAQHKDQDQDATLDEQQQQTDLEAPSHGETIHEEGPSECSQNLMPPPSDPVWTVSGQIEYENENFSPVYLTMTGNMKTSQAANPAPNFRGSELANRLRQIGSPPPEHFQPEQEESALGYSREDSSFARLQDESLPEGLPAGTPDMADMNRNVEFRRGGYSRDGSFHRKPLSPSPERIAESRPSSSRAGTAQSNTTTKHPSPPPPLVTNPTTPHRRREQFLSPDRAKGSGSPLKLFDAHDTFTSNRIQRRLSQLEYKSEKAYSVKEGTTESTKAAPKQSRLTSVEERSMQNLDQSQSQVPFRLPSFGQGQLNQHEFSGDFSAISSDDDYDAQNDSAPDESPSTDVAPPGSRQPFKFQLDESPVRRDPSKARRHISSQAGNSVRNVSRPKFVPHRKVSEPQTEAFPEEEFSEVVHEYAEGKRGPTSPFKNPTPKRRRTITAADEDEDDEDIPSDAEAGTIQRSHAAIQAVVGRTQKDGSLDPSKNIADSETLARRHILRPRNPTPSQRRREEIQAEIMEATEAFIQASPKLNTIREHLDSSTMSDTDTERDHAKAVANQVAAFTLRRQPGARDKTRKRSVTTQDFLDEALKIMDFIRTKGRPTSGLGSLEETEAETQLLEEVNDHPSSMLTFERPPSKEGRQSSWQDANKRDIDARIENHLRKYQENENDTFLNSSINSIRVSRLRGSATPEGESVVVEQDDIRITDNPNRHHTEDDEDHRPSSAPRGNATLLSTASSFGNTIVTNTSRRSECVATLAPEAVAHLIPQQVAGMSFDRDKNIWVRQKNPSRQHQLQQEEPSAMNASEDDPFGNIPDLTVEDTTELDTKAGSPVRLQPTAETILEDTEKLDDDEDSRPVTREGKGVAYTETSSAPSKASNFGWSFPKTDTRATSWSTQAPRNYSTHKTTHAPTTYAIPESEEDGVEHEIQYFEGRDHAPASVQRPRVRKVTISIAEREDPTHDSQAENTQRQRRQNQWGPSSAQQMSDKKQTAWGQTNGTRTMSQGRPGRLPVFDGDGDLSILDDAPSKNYRMELSMNVSAPSLRHGRRDTLVAAPSSPVKDVTFMLSDLPEFTLNQIDEFDLPDRVIVKHNGSRFSKALEDRYAQGTAELVKALQDVEPDEPYWEDLRNVNLRKKDLNSLHRLDELCYQLEELDVSDNKINQVEGIPYSMRRLQAQNNCLNGLTSWTTLVNLQHLDISGNDVDRLDGLAELVHLRILKADNNKIRSLQGILHLDGLMELSVRGNEIDTVDFSRTNLKSLTDLDLRKNHLLEVRNLHCLPQLQHLNLDDNEIEEFPLIDTPFKPCRFLRSIRICRNRTTMLDVDQYFPKLESLYVDGNCLTQVSGLEHLRHLRTFSAREQILNSESDMEMCASNLVRNTEVRNLYLSLNPTYGLQISQHLLSLQRLELASMGLKELPDNFGQLTPNIRSINLNFNSLTDLRPLLNIKRLSELLLAGNKLERLRANAMVLGKLATLSKLDWRDNPLTLRFYGPTCENRIMSLRQKPSDEQLTNRFVLPEGEVEADVQHLQRLDYETRIRRRVTEMMLANLCRSLRELDGLPFDKTRVLVKDDVWERLLFLGVIQRKRADTAVDDGK
ncbi:hypothetical protein G6011_09770 [Alternaria panax]|uniref:Septation initiation network scaffold protein cdc11 n=1 Tax=Alternaria panax TaxID=48097 RepID=A0AAD4FBD7_9PLEO|nr:hypothetical protein G6011_09770 [Alternaria panax]